MAIPVFKAVKPNSFETSLKKNFLSKSLAINGSYTRAVFPVPEPPQTNILWYLESSGIVIVAPVSLFWHKYTSQVYGPWSFFVSDKSIPP